MVESDAVDEPGPGDEPGALEKAAGERLGVGQRDRPAIFRDSAVAAVDNGLSYWLVMMLSGAIATLGLAMNSTAVVIGAMLVAPLLGPIMGLSLAMAVGDSRLALQSFAVVGGSLVVVVVTSAGLTALLPFHTLTLEISSRIHPTTLDLGVAVSSGLVGALVTIARGRRLSAAIPGVAVAVALIPPLSVAGFGMATGWQSDVVWGALLLLGANLAGIVLSGVVVFLLIGMHRGDVVEAARRWHEQYEPHGIARLVCRVPGLGRASVFGTAFGRAALVLGFVAALAIPLSATLEEVVREARVRGAVADAEELLLEDGATSILWRQVEIGPDLSLARIRVATAAGVSGAARDAFRERASELAGERVELRLEQLPASAGGASALQALLHGGDGGRNDDPVEWPETLARAREMLARTAWALPFPGGGEAVAVALRVQSGEGVSADSVEVAYIAAEELDSQATEVLGDVLRRSVGHPSLRTSFRRAGPASLTLASADTTTLGVFLDVIRAYPGLRVAITSSAADSLIARSVIDILRLAGVDSVNVERRAEAGPVELRMLRPAEPGLLPPD